jgi:hypothetical protein
MTDQTRDTRDIETTEAIEGDPRSNLKARKAKISLANQTPTP